MTTPWRASATPSSTSGMSVMHTGQPGPMITFRSFGNVARRPKRAIACSWLPQTCMTETGERPISAVTPRDRPASRRASSGSRNLTSAARGRVARLMGVFCPVAVDLAAHVGGHQVVLARLGEQRLVEGERLADLLGRDPADREADVVEDVVARRNRLIHDVETDLAADAPEVDGSRQAVDFERHGRALRGTSETSLRLAGDGRGDDRPGPSARPPSPGGTLVVEVHAEVRRRARASTRSASRAFWKQPPLRTTGSGPRPLHGGSHEHAPSPWRACCGSAPRSSPRCDRPS